MENMNFDSNTGEPINQTTLNEPTEKKNKNAAVFVIIGIAALLIALTTGAIVFAFSNGLFGSDKEKVAKAFSKTLNSKEETPFEKEFLKELKTLVNKSSSEQGIALRLEDASYETGLSDYTDYQISLTSSIDGKNELGSMLLGVDLGGVTLADLEIYTDKTNIMLAVPKLTDKVLTANYADDLRGQVEDSPVLGEVYSENPEEFDAFFDAMDAMKESSSKDKKVLNWSDINEEFQKSTKAVTTFVKAMDVKKTNSKEFTVNGKKVKCTGYDVAISEEDIVDFLTELEDFYINSEIMEEAYWSNLGIYDAFSVYSDISFYSNGYADTLKESTQELFAYLRDAVQDVDMTVYLTRDGKIAYMELDTILTSYDSYSSDLQVNLEMTILGGKTALENLEGVLTTTDDENEVKVIFDKVGNYDNNKMKSEINVSFEVEEENIGSFKYTGDYDVKSGDYSLVLGMNFKEYGMEQSAEISSEGVIKLEKGKSMEIDIDSILVKANGEDLIELTGSYYIKELSQEISAPEGTTMDVVSAGQMDWYELLTEVMGKAQAFMDQFGLDIY